MYTWIIALTRGENGRKKRSTHDKVKGEKKKEKESGH